MVEILVNKLLNDKKKGLEVKFKTNDVDYMVYVGGCLKVTMEEKQFNKFWEAWLEAK